MALPSHCKRGARRCVKNGDPGPGAREPPWTPARENALPSSGVPAAAPCPAGTPDGRISNAVAASEQLREASMNLSLTLASTARHLPDQPAVTWEEGVLSYAAFES